MIRLGIFISIVVMVVLISLYCSNGISKPTSELTRKIEDYDLSNENDRTLKIRTPTSELRDLSDKFNDLTKRTKDAFLFQKNSIQHISHELKTPIAVLVSELEKLQKTDDIDQLKSAIYQQTHKAKSLGNIKIGRAS